MCPINMNVAVPTEAAMPPPEDAAVNDVVVAPPATEPPITLLEAAAVKPRTSATDATKILTPATPTLTVDAASARLAVSSYCSNTSGGTVRVSLKLYVYSSVGEGAGVATGEGADGGEGAGGGAGAAGEGTDGGRTHRSPIVAFVVCFPVGQTLQPMARSIVLNMPAEHIAHFVVPLDALNVPPLHGEHESRTRLLTHPRDPAGHGAHSVDAGSSANVPIEHAWHVESLAAPDAVPKRPGVQSTHALPCGLPNFPGGHACSSSSSEESRWGEAKWVVSVCVNERDSYGAGPSKLWRRMYS